MFDKFFGIKKPESKTSRNLMSSLKSRINIIEDRLDEIANVLEYEFLRKDDPERLKLVEKKLTSRALREQKEYDKMLDVQKRAEAAEAVIKQAEEKAEEKAKRDIIKKELHEELNPPPVPKPVNPFKKGSVDAAVWNRKNMSIQKKRQNLTK
jgi:hypothetical protein